MIELTNEELRQLQMIELEMLIEVDRVCRKCGIKYNIMGGTLLGSVRHGGFIPWDDDADVAMVRDEYEKFREVCETELDQSRFYFQDFRNTEGYRWSYGKLRRKDTLFLRHNQEHMPYGQEVFIDIFPVDKAPDAMLHRKFYNFQLFVIRKLCWAAVGQYSDKNIVKRYIYKAAYKIPEKRLLDYYWKFIQKINNKNYHHARFALMPCPNKTYGYKLHWFYESAEFEFEGVKLKGIKDSNAFLTFEFGDYMKLPPATQRKVHPVSALKLVEPLLELP